MKKYRIPVSWSMEAEVIVEAEDLDQAIILAKEVPLPSDEDSSYLDSSFQVQTCLIDEFPEEYGEIKEDVNLIDN